MIKLIATDLDGSLLNVFHELDAVCRRSLQVALGAGIHVAFATGRIIRSPEQFGCGRLPVELISANGAVVFDASGQLMSYTPLDKDFLQELLTAFPTLPFSCVAPHLSYMRESRDAYVGSYVTPPGITGLITRRRVRRFLAAEEAVYEQTDAQILSADICKVNARIQDVGLRGELEAFLEEHMDVVVNDSYDGRLYEIADVSIDKGIAVARLAESLGFSEDEVAVYGDGHNDLSMLGRFSHSYAPKNAGVEAREAAAEIIGSNVWYSVPRHIMKTARR